MPGTMSAEAAAVAAAAAPVAAVARPRRRSGSRCRRRGASERLVRRHGSWWARSTRPRAGRASFVQVGDEVAANQTLCIVEAMKLMNEIAAEEMGTVREVCLEDASPSSSARCCSTSSRTAPGPGPGDGVSFKKILIANRGEVALRVMRACKELGVKTVAVYSTEDANTTPCSTPTRPYASALLRRTRATLSYRTSSAAKTTGAEAVASRLRLPRRERADFARACADNDLVFIGPSPECIERMGDKSSARETMKACGVPTVPGSDGCIETAAEAKAFADTVGYPCSSRRRQAAAARACAKCTTGRPRGAVRCGPQRGRRRVRQRRRVPGEARAAPAPRGDPGAGRRLRQQHRPVRARLLRAAPPSEAHRGSALAGADRGPAPRHGRGGHQAVRATNYKNAGTIEFLLDERGSFYFMEMNTRVQVEHPVTEQITGTDIIKEQLRIASGEPMSCADRAPFSPAGHAMEFASTRKTPAWLPSVPRHHHEVRSPGRPRRARGKLCAHGFAHLAVLRFAGGETRGIRPGSRGSARARPPRARRVRDRGHRDHDRVPSSCSTTRCSARAT